MTYGGFETTRSNVSPCTGSKKLPARNSMFVTAVQGRVELGERERALVEVGRDDMLAMRGGEQRLEAGACADVERACHPLAHGERRERHRRAVHARPRDPAARSCRDPMRSRARRSARGAGAARARRADSSASPSSTSSSTPTGARSASARSSGRPALSTKRRISAASVGSASSSRRSCTADSTVVATKPVVGMERGANTLARERHRRECRAECLELLRRCARWGSSGQRRRSPTVPLTGRGSPSRRR